MASQVVTQPTQLLDLLPTLLGVAGLPVPAYADGYTLAPFLSGAGTDPSRPPWVLSQFHGDDIPTSWFALRQGPHKLVVWGSGAEGNPLQLFDLDADPSEATNIAGVNATLTAELLATLATAIDYPGVAKNVAQYQLDMFNWWVKSTGSPEWKKQMAQGRRWSDAWAAAPAASLAAVEAWMAAPVFIQACRNATAWP